MRQLKSLLRTRLGGRPSSTEEAGTLRTSMQMTDAMSSREDRGESRQKDERAKALRFFGPLVLIVLAIMIDQAGWFELGRVIWLGIALEVLLVLFEVRLLLAAIRQFVCGPSTTSCERIS